jgi:hypothetical protein
MFLIACLVIGGAWTQTDAPDIDVVDPDPTATRA